MTVKELKKALRGVPDDVEVVAVKEGNYCERLDTSGADHNHYEYEEDGEIVKVNEFKISCSPSFCAED